jgi:hypothetical protein
MLLSKLVHLIMYRPQADQWLISPEEVLEKCPLINPDGILLGLFNPDDGHVDPYSLTQAMAACARKYGAKIYQNTPVEKTTLLQVQWAAGIQCWYSGLKCVRNSVSGARQTPCSMVGHALPGRGGCRRASLVTMK